VFELACKDFSLGTTLESGQAFRWIEREGWFYGFLGPGLVKVQQQGDRLRCAASHPALTPAYLGRYFALDLDLPHILTLINVDMQIHQALVRYPGLRVMRQDGWETLASFICASFNNIKRIESLIERLAQAYGEPVALEGFGGFTFPQPARVAAASEKALRSLGLGYRAPYLKATAQRIVAGTLRLEHLSQVDYATAKKALMGCEGVGDKVADCVALFGFEKYEAFPIDVWMERVMRYYFRHRKMTRGRLHAYAQQRYGAWAGYAQQYLYHDIRQRRTSAPYALPRPDQAVLIEEPHPVRALMRAEA
jgi:N-glycosylase/DNA lyase